MRIILILVIAICLAISYYFGVNEMTAKAFLGNIASFFLHGASLGMVVGLIVIYYDIARDGFWPNIKFLGLMILASGVILLLTQLFCWLIWQLWFAIHKQVAVWLN